MFGIQAPIEFNGSLSEPSLSQYGCIILARSDSCDPIRMESIPIGMLSERDRNRALSLFPHKVQIQAMMTMES